MARIYYPRGPPRKCPSRTLSLPRKLFPGLHQLGSRGGMGSKIISFITFLLIFLSFLELAFSQSPSSTIPSFGSSNSSSVTQTIPFAISSYTSSVTSLSGTQTIVFPTVVNVTLVPLPTSTANLSANATASATPTPITLDTQLDPAFGVLGGILIITGLPSAFLGHKNRW